MTNLLTFFSQLVVTMGIMVFSLGLNYASVDRKAVAEFARLISVARTLGLRKVDKPSRIGALQWARKYARIQKADGSIYRFADVERDYQTELLSDKSLRIVIGKSRQLGISNTLAFLAAEEAEAGGTVLVVSKNLGQAALFLQYVYTAILDAPHPDFDLKNLLQMRYVNGGTVICQAATEKAGRGIPATLVILDEYAWQAYAKAIMTAILPSLSTTKGRLIVVSTPNGQGNAFHELWEFANTFIGQQRWSVYFLPWQKNPDWDSKWEKETRSDMGDVEFAQEHEVDFLKSGMNVFSSVQIESMWRVPQFETFPDPQVELMYTPPMIGHSYISGFDIGRKKDAFVGFTIDISVAPFQIVAYERHQHMSYPDQAARIEWRHQYYNGYVWDVELEKYVPMYGVLSDYEQIKNVTHVESNGVGDPLIQFLTVPVDEFTTTVLSKKNMVDALVLLLSREELISPLIPQLKRELTNYVRDDKELVQDTIMALGIAALAAGRPVVQLDDMDSYAWYSG